MLQKLFGFDPKVSTVKTEIMAGITTFLTMAYILAVNPNILSETGMDKGALFTTTVVISAVTTMFMGLYAEVEISNNLVWSTNGTNNRFYAIPTLAAKRTF